MESSKISKSSVKVILVNDQNSRSSKKQLKFIITLIIFFTLIITAIVSVLTMIKRDYDSESPANNPHKAIESICSLTPYHQSCFRYMSNSLYKDSNQLLSSKINSSQIFSFSFHTATNELKKITSLLKSNNSLSESTPSQCKYMFNNSLSQLNSYMAVDEKNLTATMCMRSEMDSWLDTERPKIGRCLYWLKYERGLDTENASNSLAILANISIIYEMFEPSIGSVLGLVHFDGRGKASWLYFCRMRFSW